MDLKIIIIVATLLVCIDCKILPRGRIDKRGSTVTFPVFKVSNCPDGNLIVGNYSGPTCNLTDNSLFLDFSCYPTPTTDSDATTFPYTLVINFVSDSPLHVYVGDFFITNYTYGNLKVIYDPQGPIGTSVNVYFNTYTCGMSYCDQTSFYKSCNTTAATSDVDNVGDLPIISTSPSNVDFCKGGESSCCSNLPSSCNASTSTFSLNFGLTFAGAGIINSVGHGNAQAIGEIFNPPAGSTSISQFQFSFNAGGVSQSYDAFIYEWDSTTSSISNPTPVFQSLDSTISTSTYTPLVVSVTPNVALNPSQTYIAVISVLAYSQSGSLQMATTNQSNPPGYYIVGSLSGTWTAFSTLIFEAKFT